MSKQNETCSNCDYWVRNSDLLLEHGACRRILILALAGSHEDEWCSHWRPKRAAAAEPEPKP